MIKYITTLGDKVLNTYARRQKEIMQPMLKGMHCTKCNIDTVITFQEDENKLLIPIIEACCTEFEIRIRKKALPNSLK